MKKIIYSYIFLFVSTFSFGQSTIITPSRVENNSNTNNNFKVESFSNFLGFSSVRFNPTFSVVKNPVLNGNNILTLGGGGYYNSTNDIHFSKARITFTATENYSATASGSKISFFTTPNGSITPVEAMTISHDGKIQRNSTGSNNIVPIAYGVINPDGTIANGTGNFTVTRVSTGVYQIAITGVSTYTDIVCTTNYGNTFNFSSTHVNNDLGSFLRITQQHMDVGVCGSFPTPPYPCLQNYVHDIRFSFVAFKP